MREPILKAVSMPPRIFLAPSALAGANFAIQAAWMFILIGLFEINPIWPLATILMGHIFLTVAGAREPHLSRMLQAWGTNGPAMSHNIYRSRGVKLAP